MAKLPQVLCFGEILFDIISNEPGVPYDQVKSWTPYPGGAPANVACALAKLGTTAGFIGCVGQDDPGDQLMALLEQIGVNTTGVQRHATAPTREIDVILTAEGDRQFVGFRRYESAAFADTQLDGAMLPESLFAAADYFVFGTLEMPYPATSAALERALDLAQQHQVKLVLDVNWRPVFWPEPDQAIAKIRQLVQRADFLKVSEEEADLLFATRDPGAIAQQLPHVDGVLVTAGEQGCGYCIRNYQGHLPAFPVTVEETTGAGDSFLAGFIHRLNQVGVASLDDSQQVYAIVTYACAVGALTTTKAGAIAAQPTAADVNTFLHSHRL
ncbi:MAG: carbohydrate kinase [Leptolyngbyaceae bacterium]|nr:carbohydrate kinase [Leptolyngbyaceae bacterium]